jgi:hypothetical protein
VSQAMPWTRSPTSSTAFDIRPMSITLASGPWMPQTASTSATRHAVPHCRVYDRRRLTTQKRLTLRTVRMLLSIFVPFLLVAGLGGMVRIWHDQGIAPRIQGGAGTIGTTGATGATGATRAVSANATPSGALATPPARATVTPVTAAPTATASPAPQTQLTITPTPLVPTPEPQHMHTCSATQTITNNTAQTLGWAWQKPAAGGFHFQINGGPQVGWPSDTSPGVAPGSHDTLTATSDCQPQSQSFAVLMTDTRGNQYTFVLQVQ